MEKDRKIIVKKLAELIPKNICGHNIRYFYSSSLSWECEEMNFIKVICYILDLIWVKELCIDMRNSCSKLCDFDYEKMVEEKITEFVKNLKNDIIEADNKLNTENNDDKKTEEENEMDESLLVIGTWWKNKETGDIGFITDVQKRNGLIIFRFFQSGHVGAFGNMEFLRKFEISPSHPKNALESNVNNNEAESKLKDKTIAPQQVTWEGAIWYHTTGGVHVAITIKEENDAVWYVSSDNKAPGIYWQMPRKEWVKTYILYEGTIKPPCYPEGSFDKMVEETKERYERVVEMLKERETLLNITGIHYGSIENEEIMGDSKESYLKTDASKLKDFGSGAKREDKSGKGRYDLIPADVMSDFEDFCWAYYFSEGSITVSETDVSKAAYFDEWDNEELYYDFIMNMISYFFIPSYDKIVCEDDLGEVSYEITWDSFRKGLYVMRKALAKHYEEGAKVHGVDNWKKGLPVYGSERGGCFLDSMRRHTDQALQGKEDEPHAVAALWNAFGAIWTLKHKPHSTMYQNASAVKAENIVDKKKLHNDKLDTLIDSCNYPMNEDKESKDDVKDDENVYITLPSGRKVPIKFNNLKNRDPDIMDSNFLHVLGLNKNEIDQLLKDISNQNPDKKYNDHVDSLVESANHIKWKINVLNNDMIKDLREVSEANRIEEYHKMILKYYDVKYNLSECIKVLRDIVTSKNFSRLDTRVTTVYFDIYSALVILHDIINWFHEDQKAIDHIAKIITDIHAMINTGTGHICSCYKIKKLEWEICPEYLRGFECVLGDPDEDKVNILYETIGRAVNGLLNRGENGLDYFCGLGITQSLAKFNTDCLKSRIYKK